MLDVVDLLQVLEAVGAFLQMWRVRQDLTQVEVAALLHVASRTVGNWESGSRRIPPDALDRLDAAYGASGGLVDLVRAVGRSQAVAGAGDTSYLAPRRSWSHAFDSPETPVWVWLRPAEPGPASAVSGVVSGAVTSGPFVVRLDDETGTGGQLLTLPHWFPNWPFHVVLDRPGWVDFGRGEPPAWLRDVVTTSPYLSRAEFVHAPDRGVEFFARKLRERDHGDEATLVARLRSLAGPTNWDPAAASWQRAGAGPSVVTTGADEVLPPSTPEQGRAAHRQLRRALGFSRADAAVAVTRLLGPGARAVTEDQIYHYEVGRTSRIRHLPALLDRVYGGDGWTCLEEVPVRPLARGEVVVDLPSFWVGPVRVTAERAGPHASAGAITFAVGPWQNHRQLEAPYDGPVAFRFCRTPGMAPPRVSVPDGWTVRAHLGHDPGATVFSSDWSPTDAHGDEIFDLAVASLMRTVGRTVADFERALAPA